MQDGRRVKRARKEQRIAFSGLGRSSASLALLGILDTRKKICTPDGARRLLNDGPWTVVVSSFDALTLETARFLEDASAGNALMVAIVDAPGALLPVESRAALAAGLKVVTAVVIDDGSFSNTLRSEGGIRVVHDMDGDRKRLQRFREHILESSAV